MTKTLTELFGMHVHVPQEGQSWVKPKPCLECGVYVADPHRHVRWHTMIDRHDGKE